MLGLLLFVLLQDSQTDIAVITPYIGHVRSTVVCLITGQPDRHYSHYPLYWTCYVYCCLSYYRIARQTLQSLPPILDMLGLLLFVLLQDSQTDISVITPYTGHVRSIAVCLITGQPDRHYSHYPLYWTGQVYCCLFYYRIARQTLRSLPPILDMLGLLLFVLLQDSKTDITVITPYTGHVRSTAVCLITGQPDRHYSHYPLYWTCQVYCCLSYYRIARQTLQSLPPVLDMLGLLLFVLLQDNQTDITVITPCTGHVRTTAVCLITGQPDRHYSHHPLYWTDQVYCCYYRIARQTLQSLPPILDMLGLLLFVLLQNSQTHYSHYPLYWTSQGYCCLSYYRIARPITVITPYIGHVRSSAVRLITGQLDRHYSHYPLYWTCQVYCCLSYYRIARQTLQSLPPVLDMLGLLLFVLLQDSQTDIAVITPYIGHVRSTVVCLITGQPDRHCSHYPLYGTCQVYCCLSYYRIASTRYSHYPLYWTCQVYCCLSYYRIARQTLQSLPPILDMLGLLLFVLLQDSQTDITVITPYIGHVRSTVVCLITGQPDRHYRHYPLYWTCYVYCCLSYYRIARQTLQSLPPILDMLGLLLFVLLQDSQTDITVITPCTGHVRSTAVCLITGQPDRHYSHYPLYWTCQVYYCLSYYRIARQTLQSLPPILDMLSLLLFVLLQDSQTDIAVITPCTGQVRSTVVCLITGQPDRHYSHYPLYWTCQVYCCLSYYRIARHVTVITPYIGHVRSSAVCLITGQPDRHYSQYPLYWTCQVYCCLSYYRIARQTLQSLPPVQDMLGLLLFVLLQDSQTRYSHYPLYWTCQVYCCLSYYRIARHVTVITPYIGHVRSTAVCLITGQPDTLQSFPPILDMLGLLLFVLLQDSQTCYSHYPLYWTCQVYCCLSYYRIARHVTVITPYI